jgi:hypothetical protein
LVLVGHASPGQQSWPLPPHTLQVVVALSQTNGSPQTLPPLIAVQHGSPLPPQATHVVVAALHVLKGAVHPTPPTQHALPIAPQVALLPTQAPAVHVPAVPPHLAVGATHMLLLWSQHPPPVQRLPSQQGLPVVPHVAHEAPAALHARLAAVQNFAAAPLPFGLPGQHPMPLVPHGFTAPVPVPPVQSECGPPPPAVLQVPRTALPHEAPAAMHAPSTQQSLAVVQLFA